MDYVQHPTIGWRFARLADVADHFGLTVADLMDRYFWANGSPRLHMWDRDYGTLIRLVRDQYGTEGYTIYSVDDRELDIWPAVPDLAGDYYVPAGWVNRVEKMVAEGVQRVAIHHHRAEWADVPEESLAYWLDTDTFFYTLRA